MNDDKASADSSHSVGDVINPMSKSEQATTAPSMQPTDSAEAYPEVKPAPTSQIEDHKKGAHSMIAIVIAVLLVMTLVGIAYYAYDNSSTDEANDADTSESVTTSDNQAEDDNQVPATDGVLAPDDIDSELSEIDSIIDDIEAVEDVNIDELSDESLEII